MAASTSVDGKASICRLCEELLTQKGKTKSRWSNVLKSETGLDLDQDTDSQPQYICEHCYQKLVRWEKKNKKLPHGRRSKLQINIKEFQEQDPSLHSSKILSVLEEFAAEHGHHLKKTEGKAILIVTDNEGNSRSCLHVLTSGEWEMYVYGRRVPLEKSHFSDVPRVLNADLMPQFLFKFTSSHICPGNPEYVVQDCVLNRKPAYIHYQPNSRTVRHETCPLLISTPARCSSCKIYRSDLASILKRTSSKSSPAPKTNYRHIRSVKLAKRLRASKVKGKIMRKKIHHLEKKIQKHFQDEALKLGEINSDALREVFMKESDSIRQELPENSPQKLLWDEQLKCLSRHPKGRRWHPAIIRLCIALCAKSSAAYELLQSSGFLTLPTQRNLRQYTQFTKSQTGFSREYFDRVCADLRINDMVEHQKNVILALDEMKVSQGLVYSHSSGEIIGFTSLGIIGDELAAFTRKCSGEEEPEMATHALVLMIRAISSAYRVPMAYFATSSARSDELYSIVMEALEYLDVTGFIVRGIVSDGASQNRGLYKILTAASEDSYKFTNPINGKTVYLLSDVPHLVKTARNNLENSGYNRNTRNMKFRGLCVSWQHILRVYEWDLGKASSLRMLHRITEEHLNLTPALRMKVKLAAQVLSSTMANALKVQSDPRTESTRLFIEYMDLFFDCLNVARLQDGERKRKPALHPYRDVDDWRFTWLEEDFLSFLKEWTTEADTINIPRNEKEKLHLSWQTLEGMEITVKSFVALTRELLSEGVPYILSEKFSQDPLEEYFAKQRGMGGGHDNPSVAQFGTNMLKIHVAGTSIRASKRANVSTEGHSSGIDSTPLPRKRARRLFKK